MSITHGPYHESKSVENRRKTKGIVKREVKGENFWWKKASQLVSSFLSSPCHHPFLPNYFWPPQINQIAASLTEYPWSPASKGQKEAETSIPKWTPFSSFGTMYVSVVNIATVAFKCSLHSFDSHLLNICHVLRTCCTLHGTLIWRRCTLASRNLKRRKIILLVAKF